MGFFDRFRSPPQIEIAARPEPEALSPDALQDVVLSLSLTNPSKRPLTVFPRAARFAAEAGWVGPWWRFELSRAGKPLENPVVIIRTSYEPPGHPPSPSYWEYRKLILPP